MNFLKYAVALSATAFLIACDSGTSSSDSPYGDLKYTAPLKKDGMEFSCDVYATGSSATLIAEAEMFGSTLKNQTSAVWHSDGSYSVTVNAQYSGMFLMDVESECESAKRTYGENYVVCNEDQILADRRVEKEFARPLSDSAIQLVTTNLNAGCDKIREGVQEQFEKMSSTPANPDGGSERASSCDVDVVGNVITQKIVFPARTATIVYTHNGSYVDITETYTGVDEMTLQSVCIAAKSDPDLSNVVCDIPASTIKSTSSTGGAPLESMAQYIRDGLCAGLLGGNITLEELWYN